MTDEEIKKIINEMVNNKAIQIKQKLDRWFFEEVLKYTDEWFHIIDRKYIKENYTITIKNEYPNKTTYTAYKLWTNWPISSIEI